MQRFYLNQQGLAPVVIVAIVAVVLVVGGIGTYIVLQPERGEEPDVPPAPAGGGDDRDDGDGEDEWEVLLKTGFETQTEGDVWTGTLLQEPSGQEKASITASAEVAHSGLQSIKLFAPPRMFDLEHDREFCGKASLKNTNIILREGDTVKSSAWFYLTDPPTDAFFFLMDVECTEDECGYMGAPGVRLRIPAGEPHLQAEWKFLNYFPNRAVIASPPPKPPVGSYTLPAGEWFKVTLLLMLGQGDRGITEIYVNDTLDSRVVGTNISPGGVLANMTRYDSFEIGLTCNSSGSIPTTIYIDDVLVRRKL